MASSLKDRNSLRSNSLSFLTGVSLSLFYASKMRTGVVLYSCHNACHVETELCCDTSFRLQRLLDRDIEKPLNDNRQESISINGISLGFIRNIAFFTLVFYKIAADIPLCFHKKHVSLQA